MKFQVGAKALYSTLSGVSKVINSKNTLAVLDNFLLTVAPDGRLTVTASDTETTLSMSLQLSEDSDKADDNVSFLVNARRLADIAKELPDVDIKIDVDTSNYKINISFPGGQFDLVGSDPAQYPVTTPSPDAKSDQDQEQSITFLAPGSQILDGINRTLFAVGTDDLRPQMMGIFWDIKEGGITFVATDTRKLVRYVNSVGAPGVTASFILPVKPANVLKNLLTADEDVTVVADRRSATFSTDRLRLTTRFTKGNYPDYNRVIPKNNQLVATIDRGSMLSAVRRVAVCADPSHGMIKFRFTPEGVELKVDDANFSTFATEQLRCDYTGTSPLIIGFGASYLVEILSMLPTQNVIIRLSDPSRPGVFLPDEQAEKTDLVAILMPMTVQDF